VKNSLEVVGVDIIEQGVSVKKETKAIRVPSKQTSMISGGNILK
jgi:hypothetical protein